jgi:hypothetical protein
MAPAASRRLSTVLAFSHRNGASHLSQKQVGRRRAHNRLDEVSNQLRSLGESLGEDGENVFGSLADRVDRVLNTVDQTEF